jgi:hypothetical protein
VIKQFRNIVFRQFCNSVIKQLQQRKQQHVPIPSQHTQ